MYLTVDELRSLAVLFRHQRGYRTVDSILREKAEFATTKTYDVFLSHSFMDAEIVLGVVKFIEDQGKTVYVDWLEDRDLDRENVTAATADLLRTRMKASSSLVYAASTASTQSKWMPWEVGYFDGMRPGLVSILPIVDRTDSEWKGQEYLGLYPVIDRLRLSNGLRPFVVKKDKSAQPLSEFGDGRRFIWNDVYGRAM